MIVLLRFVSFCANGESAMALRQRGSAKTLIGITGFSFIKKGDPMAGEFAHGARTALARTHPSASLE
jgi:hypothetical protein